MKAIRRLLVGLLTPAVVACGPPPPQGFSDSVDRVVATAMAEGPITGVAVVVARGTRILHEAGYGYADLENELPVTPRTVFRVGSITKQFTAATLVDLAQDGDLDLAAPIAAHLPDYPSRGADQVTLSMLLSHTGGIRNYTTMGSWWERATMEMSPDRLIASFSDEPLDFEPGTRFSYSNSGYVLLGRIAESVVGRPYGGILNERFFVPLDMESTRYCDDRALIANRARGYRATDEGFLHASYVSMSQAYAAGGVCSSAADLVRWTQYLTAGATEIGGDGYALMTTPARLSDGTSIEYGYGMAIGHLEGHRRVGHVGGMLGFSSQLSHYPDDNVTIAVLTNTEDASAAALESAIARLLFDLEDRAIVDLPLTAAQAARYEGTYDLSLTRVTVSGSGGRLRADVDVPGLRDSYVLLHQGGDAFVAEDDSEITVEFTSDGETIDGVVLHHEGIVMRGTRLAP